MTEASRRIIITAVKQFICTIFFCLPSLALGNGPGQAALDFIRKVKAGELDLNPGGDTALREQTSAQKCEDIGKRLEWLVEPIAEADLELGEVREDGRFAAVMVRYLGNFDSMTLQVYPVALVRNNGSWLPAPVLGSFENAVAGYTVPLKKRLDRLEEWMMEKRVTDLQKLVTESNEKARKKIRESIVGEDLEGSDLIKLTELFLESCRNRNQSAILGFLGGLSDPLPDDWQEMVRLSRYVVSGDAGRTLPWRLVVSPDVIRIPVDQDLTAESGMVSVACLDPKRAESGGTMEKIVMLHFGFEKDPQGRWKIDLPGSLEHNDAEDLLKDEGMDVDLLDRFAGRLREKQALEPAKTAEEAVVKVIGSLISPDVHSLMRFVEFGSVPKNARVSCAAAAAKWWSLHEPGNFRAPVKLGFRAEGDLAVAAFQWFSANRSEQFNLEPLFFIKVEQGWVWAPRIAASGEKENQRILSAWLKNREPGWRDKWREALLGKSLRLESLPLGETATAEQVIETMDSWINALDRKDLAEAIKLTAWLGEDDDVPAKMLRNISYELSYAEATEREFLGIFKNGPWIAAGVANLKDGKKSYSFIPVFLTEEGARIVPEIDLIVGETRTRDFLNEASLDRMRKTVGDEEMEAFRTMFGEFIKKFQKAR